MNHRTPVATITMQDFLADPHAAKYRDVVDRHPEAFARVGAILNDPRLALRANALPTP